MNCEILKRSLTAAAIVALSACGINRGAPQDDRPAQIFDEPAEPSPQTYALGLQLTQSGAVADNSTANGFKRGNVLYLSVDVASASATQHIDVRWADASGRVVHEEDRTVPTGSQYAAFSSGPTSRWVVGTCRATVAINGRIVNETRFALM